MEPETPINVKVTAIGAAFAATAMATLCGVPTFRVKFCGVIDTLVDCPLISTVMGDEKPFTAEADTETLVEVPAAMVVAGGFTAVVKSGVGGGGGVCCVPPPPPQPAATRLIENAPRIR